MTPQAASNVGTNPEMLKFIVAPHIVQDLGLNLYTSLPRVLVEFVANAYDADATQVAISVDKDRIEKERNIIKAEFNLEKVKSLAPTKTLAERCLPDEVEITVVDDGVGMSMHELQEKYLVAGRRRRETDNQHRTPGGRVLMGRKGLGKLAGFGVAQRITVVSKKANELHATEIVLDYGELIKVTDTNEIRVPTRLLPDGGGIVNSGTRISLSRLLYEPMKSKMDTIANELADHFTVIDPRDFAVHLNDDLVEPTPRNHSFAWPEPELPISELVSHTYKSEQGPDVTFSYRIRFTIRGEALPASQRGIRIYAHSRLAAAPSLLGADTNMHGFRMTDYMDGVVHADVIDDQPSDYIATDRQNLRWDTPLLSPMYAMLSEQIRESCKQCQAHREAQAPNEVREDQFTAELIQDAELSKSDEKMAYKLAELMASRFKKGVDDRDYKAQLPLFVNAIGQRDILKAISDLASKERPDLVELVAQVIRLADTELDEFLKFTKARLDGITALKKICEHQDFKKGKNEAELHRLFETAPWLINPLFQQFLTSDVTMSTTLDKLSQELRIGKFAPEQTDPDDETRPDLVFVLGSEGIDLVVIVELKAPNTPLTSDHLDQLKMYMRKTRAFLKQVNKNPRVDGYLVGMFAPSSSRAVGVELLREAMDESQNRGDWKVLSILQLLENANVAHKDLLKIQSKRA